MNDDSGMVGLALDAQAVAVGEGVLHPAVNIAQADAHALGLDLPALQLGQHILVHAGAVVLHVQVHGAVLRPAPNAYDAGFQHFLRGIVEEALQVTGFAKENLAMVGDRLYTDIATGVNFGMTSILVLSGETTQSMLDASEIRPSAVFGRLSDMIPYL